MTNIRKHAIVLGGSMSGLITTRVLSEHFEKVTLIEKDKLNDYPEPRKGQPQARHLHVLLKRGLQTIENYFPTITEELVSHGTVEMDIGNGTVWYSFGGTKQNLSLGIKSVTMTRQLLEYTVRKRVKKIDNVRILDETNFVSLSANEDRIQGVTISNSKDPLALKTLNADLVIDATGRGSHTPKWLETHNYQRPKDEKTFVNITYKTAIYDRDTTDFHQQKVLMYSPEPPNKIGVMIMPIENKQSLVCLAGWHRAVPPTEEKELLSFLKELPDQKFHKIISKAKRKSEFAQYKFSNGIRRYYEKLDDFPLGYLVIGDAVCSFNPVHGQGMTSVCLQAEVLDKVLKKDLPERNTQKLYFKEVAKVIDLCWNASAYENFRYEETIGKKPKGTTLINKYMTAIHKAANKDKWVYGEFVKVAVMLKPAKTLFAPQFFWRVLKANISN